MGGAVSAGENNDELIDNLLEANYIRTKQIEDIFRAVDRGSFYLRGHRDTAYHDLAWKHEHLHISAPCIYSEVMGSLQLRSGLSFLNIGSGTGYLSTMAGLMLGPNGINHGIELHSDVVEYARTRVEDFISSSHAFDRYVFCEPEFSVGNCLNLSPDVPSYDRIYCGAACPPEYESFMRNLLNVGGILVMPLNDQLQVIQRVNQTKWDSKNILSVNFASLVVPQTEENSASPPKLPERNPPTLRFVCRSCIRKTLSAKFHKGSLRIHKKRKIPKEASASSSSSSDDSSDNSDEHSTRRNRNKRYEFSDDSLEDSDSDDNEKDSPLSKVRRSSSILNVATGTVTDVVDDSPTKKSPKDEQSVTKVSGSTSSKSNKTNPQRDGESGESLDWVDVETSKSCGSGSKATESRKRKEKTRNLFSSGSTKKNGDGNGKMKRSKRGCYPFFRRRYKTKSSEANATENKEVVEKPSEETSSAQPQQSTSRQRTFVMYEETRTRSAEQGGQSTTSFDLHVGSDSVTTLRSFLVGCANRTPSAMRTTDLLSLITDRAMRRINSSSTSSDDEDDKQNKVEKFEKEENTSNVIFREAILMLPVPESVKNYLLYYRE